MGCANNLRFPRPESLAKRASWSNLHQQRCRRENAANEVRVSRLVPDRHDANFKMEASRDFENENSVHASLVGNFKENAETGTVSGQKGDTPGTAKNTVFRRSCIRFACVQIAAEKHPVARRRLRRGRTVAQPEVCGQAPWRNTRRKKSPTRKGGDEKGQAG